MVAAGDELESSAPNEALGTEGVAFAGCSVESPLPAPRFGIASTGGSEGPRIATAEPVERLNNAPTKTAMTTIAMVGGTARELLARGCAGRPRRTFVCARSGRPFMAIPPLCRELISESLSCYGQALPQVASRRRDGRPTPRSGKSAAGVGRGQVRAPGAASCNIPSTLSTDPCGAPLLPRRRIAALHL